MNKQKKGTFKNMGDAKVILKPFKLHCYVSISVDT